jgi:hypothetical protein
MPNVNTSVAGPSLKYLFTAQYTNGTTYQQNAEDVSHQDPLRSCFYDVDHTQLASFSLTDGQTVYTVSLQDGHFEVNGVAFAMHDPQTPLTDRRLIFFRQHTHTFNAGYAELSHAIEYQMGWQANDAQGKNVQHVMRFN